MCLSVFSLQIHVFVVVILMPQDAELLQCLCVWILTSVSTDIIEEATSHINESLSHHMWNLHDLSNLWKTLLQKRKIRALSRGFQLFQKVNCFFYLFNQIKVCNIHTISDWMSKVI